MPVYDDQKIDAPHNDLDDNGSSADLINGKNTSTKLRDKEESLLDDVGAKPLDEEEQAKLDDIEKNLDEDEDDDENTIGSGYKDTGEKKLRLSGVFTKKRGITGIVIGLIFGGGVGFLTISSGPLQFVHMSQLLQRFHFASSEDASDDRMSKIGRFIRYRNNAERTRMGLIGNLYADSIESKFNKSGVESAYTERLRYFDGYVIDPLKIPEDSALGDLQNKTPEEIKSHLAERYSIAPEKINIDLEKGKVLIDAEGLGYFKSRGLTKGIMEDIGFSKITAALRTRIMAKRYGSTLHPMRKLDQKVLKTVDARLAKWREERQQRIDNGEQRITTDTPEQDTNGDGKADPVPQETLDTESKIGATIGEAAEASNEIAKGAVPSAPSEGSLAKLRASTSAKLAGGVSAAIGVICLVKGLSDNIDNIKYLNVVLPLTRMGIEAVSIGNQVMTGQDVDSEQLGYFAKQLNDPVTGSWLSARSIQAELGQDQTGPDIGEEAKLGDGKNVVSEFIDSIPGVGAVCKAANSVVGQVVTFGIDLIGGPVSAVGGQLLSRFAFGPLLEKLTRWIAGHPIDINVAGANYGNYINYGARLAANDTAISGGGTLLSPLQVAELDQHNQETAREDIQSKSFADRFFNPNESYSLVAQIIDKQNPDITQNFASIFTHATGVTKTLFNTLSSLISPRIHAATPAYDYGFPEYGFSVEDLNNPIVNNPFENAEKAADALNGPLGDTYVERAKKCFGIIIDKANLKEPSAIKSTPSPPNYKTIPGECSDTNDPDWLHVRFLIFDTQITEAAVCYNSADETSCKAVDIGN